MSSEEFRALSPAEIANRTILDPAISSAAFNWRKAIDIELADRVSYRAVAAALDRLASIPEGRQLLRQAVLNQRDRAEQSDVPARLRIVAGDHNEFSRETGEIRFSMKAMKAISYSTTKGPAPLNVLHTMTHELLHAADGMITPHYYQLMHQQTDRFMKACGMDPTISLDIFTFRQFMQNTLYKENAAIIASNAILGPHFKQPARLLTDTADDKSMHSTSLPSLRQCLGPSR